MRGGIDFRGPQVNSILVAIVILLLNAAAIWSGLKLLHASVPRAPISAPGPSP